MKTFVFNREELSILIYALVASKESIDVSQHPTIDHLIQTLNK
jgi:hypothetical protein